MADFSHEDSQELIDAMHRLAGRFSGWNPADEPRESKTVKQQFDQGLKASTESLKLMHGSTQHASFALQKLVGFGAIGTAIMGVINSISSTTDTFNKMTDVGLNFGGSIIEMQKQAADSGLSLDEFARNVQKSSTVIAQMGDTQTTGVHRFTEFQKGVRNNLKEFGYYGMTLSQVNDASSDLGESLRRTGVLSRMSDRELSKAGSEYIKQVNAMAAATGKSREEIMKLTSQALRDPAAASRLAELGPEATEAFNKALASLASGMGESGHTLTQMLSQLIGTEGRGWATDFGDVAIKAGMPGIVKQMEGIQRRIAAGDTQGDFFDEIENLTNTVRANAGTLRTLRLDPQSRAGADQLLKFLSENRGFNAQQARERAVQAETDRLDGVTQAAQMFETNFHEITAKFRHGMYSSIASMITGSKDEKERNAAFEKTLDRIKNAFEDLGKAAGGLLGLFLDVLPFATKAFSLLVEVIDGIRSKFEKVARFLGLGEASKPFAATVTAGLVAAGGIWFKRFLGRVMQIEARTVNIFTRNPIGGLHGQGDLFDQAGGGGGGPRGPGRIRTRWQSMTQGLRGGGFRGGFKALFAGLGSSLKSMVSPRAIGSLFKGLGSSLKNMISPSSVRGALSGIGRTVWAGVTGVFKSLGRGGLWGTLLFLFIDPILNMFGEFKGKKTLSSMASYAGLGAMIGSFIPIIGTTVGAIIGAIFGAFMENFESLNIGNMLSSVWGAAKWVGSLINGMFDWIGKKISGMMPEWMQKLIGTPTCPPTPTAAGGGAQPAAAALPATVDQMKTDIAKTIAAMAQEGGDPLQKAMADKISAALGAVTPDLMAAEIRKVQGPDRSFLTAPVAATDTFETLNQRLLDLVALQALDEQKQKAGDQSQQTALELQKSLAEQMQIAVALLDRGNNQREDGNRRRASAF